MKKTLLISFFRPPKSTGFCGGPISVSRSRHPSASPDQPSLRHFRTSSILFSTVFELHKGSFSSDWTANLAKSQSILKTKMSVSESVKDARLPSMDKVIRRLRKTQDANTHLLDTFSRFFTDSNDDSCIHWPGTVTLLLARAIGNPFASDNFVSKALEDVIWTSQLTLAEIINLLHRSLLFHREHQRVTSSRKEFQNQNSNTSRNNILQLVSNYLASAAVYKIGRLNNYKAAWLIASVLESLAEAKQLKRPYFIDSLLIQSVEDWEYRTYHRGGILVANGCQATLELAGHGTTVQQMGFEFGRSLALALKAHSDIQQFVNYQRSVNSRFELSSLPVVLHLENNPETLAYIYSCGDSFDNLDYYMLHSMMATYPVVEQAKKQLQVYVDIAIKILQEFEKSPSTTHLIKVTEILKEINQKCIL